MQNRKEEDSYERRQKIYKKANEAYKAYHARRWARARQLFAELLDLDQRHPSYRHAMADIEHNLGNFEDSIKHRKKEIQYSLEPSKRSYTDLLKSYMALLNTFGQGERSRELEISREIALNYTDYLTRTNLKIIENILLQSSEPDDHELIQSAKEAVLSPHPFKRTAGNANIALYARIVASHKAKQCALLSAKTIAWVAKWAKPPYLCVQDLFSPTWIFSDIRYPADLVVLNDAIVLTDIDWEHEKTIIRAWKHNGDLIYESSQMGTRVIAEPDEDRTNVLIFVSSRGQESDYALWLILSETGTEIARKNTAPGERWRKIVRRRPSGWMVARSSDICLLDRLGNQQNTWKPAKNIRRIKTLTIDFIGLASTKEFGYESEFSLLGIESTTDKGEIKKAFRQKAMEWHPDRNPEPGATAMMQRINDAYDILKSLEITQIKDIGGEWIEISSDDLITGIAPGVDGEIEISCRSGQVYNYHNGTFTAKIRLKEWIEVLGSIGSKVMFFLEDGRLVVADHNSIRELSLSHFHIPWRMHMVDVNSGAAVFLASDGSHYAYLIEAATLQVSEFKFRAPIAGMSYLKGQNLIMVSADSMYLLRYPLAGCSHPAREQ